MENVTVKHTLCCGVHSARIRAELRRQILLEIDFDRWFVPGLSASNDEMDLMRSASEGPESCTSSTSTEVASEKFKDADLYCCAHFSSSKSSLKSH
jgi:hypothetical protein